MSAQIYESLIDMAFRALVDARSAEARACAGRMLTRLIRDRNAARQPGEIERIERQQGLRP